MIVESRLAAWLQAGLDLYKAYPLLVEGVFFDMSQVGTPTRLVPDLLEDTTKLWLPNEFAGGTLRYSDTVFPIVSNTASALTLTGDPSLLTDPDHLGYSIVPPAAAKFLQYLQSETFTVESAFPQAPAAFPAFSIRLEKDTQGTTYIAESVERFVLGGVEVDANRTALTGSYLISIWTGNRDATLWLYAWLQNYALHSIQQLESWGLYDISLGGSDLDPALQFLPERTYVRHVLLTATREERALATQDVEYVDRVGVTAILAYAPFTITIAED